jgi:hypothetical protein
MIPMQVKILMAPNSAGKRTDEKEAVTKKPATIGPIPLAMLPPMVANPFKDARCDDSTVLFKAMDMLVKNMHENILERAMMATRREKDGHVRTVDDNDESSCCDDRLLRSREKGMNSTGKNPRKLPIEREGYNPNRLTVVTYTMYWQAAKTSPAMERTLPIFTSDKLRPPFVEIQNSGNASSKQTTTSEK